MPEKEGRGAAGPASRIAARLEDPAAMRKATAIVLSAAALLRIAWALLVPVHPVSDSNAYDVFAMNIAAGNGYAWEPGQPTAYWPVGTSAVYAFLYLLFGHSYVPIVALNIALGTAVVALAMSLARRWASGAAAVIAGAALAAWPLMIEFTTVLASELLFMFLILASLQVAAGEGGRPWARRIAAGLLLAAAAYVRPLALAFFPLLYLPDLFKRGRRAAFLASCVATALAMILAILPWTYRNYRVFGSPVLISTNGGSNFWMGNNPDTDGGYAELPDTGIADEVGRDRELKRRGMAYVEEEPLRFVARTLVKAVKLHDRETIGVAWNEEGIAESFGGPASSALKAVGSLYWYLALGLAMVGAALVVRERGLLRALIFPPATAWIYFAAVHSVTVVNDRYHMPSIPFIAILAGFAVKGLYDAYIARSRRER